MNSIVKTLEHRVTDFLKKYGLFYNASILVAFSGGPDSTALLHILHSLAKQKKLDLQISAVYVNHNLRSEYEIQKEIGKLKNLELLSLYTYYQIVLVLFSSHYVF